MGGVGWMTPNFDPTYSLYRLSLGPVLDFVDLGCLEVNVKFVWKMRQLILLFDMFKSE